MQSEEIETPTYPAESNTPAMAITDSTEVLPQNLKQMSSDEIKVVTSCDFKLDGLDFEADIDKMDSPTSCETEDDSKNEEALENIFKPTVEASRTLPDQSSNESIRTWLQRITQMQNEIQKKLHVSQNALLSESATKPTTATTPSRVVKYQDLPYMGEMTLDNSKPRRGRKPKKADICHLIYKNYGTIFPGTPNAKSIVDRDVARKLQTEQKYNEALNENLNRTDVQNRIISSLLEKRLTQESKRQKEVLANKSKPQAQKEPLNLCIRDMNHLKIRLKPEVEVKSEPQSDDEVEFVHETPSPASTVKDFKFPAGMETLSPPALPPDAIKMPENGVAPGGYVYWPNAGVFIHPMALQQQLLYYQKIASNNNFTIPNRPSPETTPEVQAKELRKLVPKQTKSKKHEVNEDEVSGNFETKTKRNASGGDKTPAKRKRSAIFIPPIPTENQNNPATEVSICKFKFTGGAKPSLQEKKMLSVDSGGNFRYYSGTGDKSMRGYEFFPRETLQQQINNTQGSSTGAFLQASGEKIYPSSPVDFAGKVNEFMLTPEIQNPTPSVSDTSVRSKKRKSRKSLQREKLEQTFKEKGFLIQTQQLESAEGATYCKFRQLRKFTRYLFRSWKDYLPGNVAEGAEESDKPEIGEISEQDLENLSNLSSPGLEGDTSPPP